MTHGQWAAKPPRAAAASALGYGPKQTCQKVAHAGRLADRRGAGATALPFLLTGVSPHFAGSASSRRSVHPKALNWPYLVRRSWTSQEAMRV